MRSTHTRELSSQAWAWRMCFQTESCKKTLLHLLLALVRCGSAGCHALPPRRAGQDKKVHHQGLPEERRSCGNAQEGSYRIPALRVSCGVRLWVTYFKQPSWAPVEPVMLLAASSCLAPTNDADVAMSAAAITLMSQV
jgi:hypothetical protein